MRYPHIVCWSAVNTPIAIASSILLVIFALFALLVGLTYYEYDPSVMKTYARLQNRFEFGTLCMKIIIVFVTVFLQNMPLLFAIVSFFSAIILLGGAVFMLPAYEKKVNYVRAGSYGGVLWINITMMLAIAIDDSSNYTSTIAAGAGLPFAIAIGAFLANRRLKYLCNPSLVDGFISSEEGNTATRRPNGRKVVKWEQPQANKLLKNKLYSRFLFPTDVEIAARFVLDGKPNAALIEKAKAVYQTGFSKFPRSPTVMQAYANFIFTTVGDWQALTITDVALEKLRKMTPFIDISFFIYRYDKDREQKMEGGNDKIGDFVDFMEYKKLHHAAKRYHMMALVCIRKFWRYLLDSKIDVMQLSTLSGKIATAEKKAAEHYEKLLQQYPKNIRVLRDYARFLDEIVRNEKLAQAYWKKADRYEEKEMEKLTDSHRSANEKGAALTPRQREKEAEEDKDI